MARATQTINPLHFEDLEPHRFEDLVRQLIYDFRDWAMLEALGRSGADDGIDIRGIEAIDEPIEFENTELEEESTSLIVAHNESREEKVWFIQCKRYSKLTPKQIEEIVESNLSGQQNHPYGYILVAACDFSLSARNKFQKAIAKNGIQEAYLIGKAELEDMLFRPSNDHLLFAYFGISLQIRRRSSRTRLRSNIALKRAIIKYLGELHGRPDKYVLIRDSEDKDYPYIKNREEFWTHPQWRYWQFAGHRPPDHITLVKRKCYAYFNFETEEWDALLDYDTEHLQSDLFDMPERFPAMETLSNEYYDIWFYELPKRCRAWYYEFATIPYDRIVALDDLGDAYNKGPHLFVNFRAPGNPFESETYQFIELVEGYESQTYRVQNFKRNNYLRKLYDRWRKERNSSSEEERRNAIINEMSQVRTEFLNATSEYISQWYWKTVTLKVENKSEHSRSLGREKLSELKSEVKSLQQQAHKIVEETVGAESLWWEIKPGKQDYSFYGNRAPEELDDAIRLAAGCLGSVLKKYSYLDAQESWRKSSRQQYYSTETRPYYPHWLDWSNEMRLLLERYESLHNRIRRLTPTEYKAAPNERDEEIKQLWLEV